MELQYSRSRVESEAGHRNKEEPKRCSNSFRASTDHLYEGSKNSIEKGIAANYTEADLSVLTCTFTLVHLSPGNSGTQNLAHLLEGGNTG